MSDATGGNESREMTLSRRISARTARLTIIGQGYVGLPLAVEFAKAGFSVVGFGTDPDRVAALGYGGPRGTADRGYAKQRSGRGPYERAAWACAKSCGR